MKIGFIGGGNMATAIFGGMVGNGIANAADIMVYDPDTGKLQQNSEKYGICAAESNLQIAQECDMVFLAVKPQYLADALAGIRGTIGSETAYISIVAGWDNARLKQHMGGQTRILRVLPNTPLLVGEGMSAICTENDLSTDELDYVRRVFSSMGKVIMAPEKQIAIISAISGSGPAYAFIFIEALADAACLHGIPRDQAYLLASQTLLGSGKMVLESGQHPAQLKDAVCSPGGTTIEAVYALESGAFRATVIDAVDAAYEKFHNL